MRSGKTMDRYRQVIRDFIASLGSRANLALADVSRNTCSLTAIPITEARKTARTANLSVKVVSAAFNAAVRQDYIQTNPATALESLPENRKKQAAFTWRRCRSSCGPRGRLAGGNYPGLLHWRTAWRRGEYALGARSIGTRRIVRFTPSKTKKAVTIPLHSQLERELLKNAGIGNAPMFPTLAGRDTGGKHGLSGRFNAIMEKSGHRRQTNKGQRRADIVEPNVSLFATQL